MFNSYTDERRVPLDGVSASIECGACGEVVAIPLRVSVISEFHHEFTLIGERMSTSPTHTLKVTEDARLAGWHVTWKPEELMVDVAGKPVGARFGSTPVLICPSCAERLQEFR